MKRRDGYPWDPSVFAGVEALAVPSGHMDLLAMRKKGEEINALLVHFQNVSAASASIQAQAIVDPLLHVVEKQVEKIARNGGTIETPAEYAQNQIEERIKQATIKAYAADQQNAKQEITEARIQKKKEFQNEERRRKTPEQSLLERSKVPWTLLDALDAERKKLTTEKRFRLMFKYRRCK